MKFYPTCNCCGQRQIYDDSFDTQTEADVFATLNCPCSGAEDCRKKEKDLQMRDGNIKLIRESIEGFNNFCELRKVELTDERKDMIFSAAVAILDDTIRTSSLGFMNVKVAIKKSSKDKIEIKFTSTDSVSAEV